MITALGVPSLMVEAGYSLCYTCAQMHTHGNSGPDTLTHENSGPEEWRNRIQCQGGQRQVFRSEVGGSQKLRFEKDDS